MQPSISYALHEWLMNPYLQPVGKSLFEQSEIPDWVLWHHLENGMSLDNEYTTRALDNKVLHNEKSLMFDEAHFIKQRIQENDRVNIFDIGETYGLSALPFIYELLVDRKVLGTYVACSGNKKVNAIAGRNLKMFAMNSRLYDPNVDTFHTDGIIRNFEVEESSDLVKDITHEYYGERVSNVFLLLNSALGNSLYPEILLRNIQRSMGDNDYLVILQGIYKDGIESLLVADYHKWYHDEDNFYVTKQIASYLNPQYEFEVNWDEKTNGIETSVVNAQPKKLFGVEIAGGQKVRLLRSTRFSDEALKKMFVSMSFRIVSVTYDRDMTSAMYFLKK